MSRLAAHQTQCPYCHHHFNVTNEALVIKSGYARCPDCGRLFHALDQYPAHVVTGLSLQPPAKPRVSTTPPATSRALTKANSAIKPPSKTQVTIPETRQPAHDSAVTEQAGTMTSATPLTIVPQASQRQTGQQATALPADHHVDDTKDLASDVLFDDKTGLDGDSDTNLVTALATTPATPKLEKTTTGLTTALDFEWVDDFAAIPTATTHGYDGEKTTKAPISDSQEEAWLAKLLEPDEANESEVSPAVKANHAPVHHAQAMLPNHALEDFVAPKANDDNVSDLLAALGVGTKEDIPSREPDYLHKVNQRLNTTPTAKPDIDTHATRLKTVFWAAGCGLLALALMLQYVIFNLDTLVKNPATARSLAGVCALLPVDCNLPLANTQAIDSRVLSVIATPRDRAKSDLVFTLKNTSAESVLYPNLKITLRRGNEPKAQLLLTPAQYVSSNSTQLNAQQLTPIKLRIDYPKRQFEQVNIEMFY